MFRGILLNLSQFLQTPKFMLFLHSRLLISIQSPTASSFFFALVSLLYSPSSLLRLNNSPSSWPQLTSPERHTCAHTYGAGFSAAMPPFPVGGCGMPSAAIAFDIAPVGGLDKPPSASGGFGAL
jgi:hypothetical protein